MKHIIILFLNFCLISCWHWQANAATNNTEMDYQINKTMFINPEKPFELVQKLETKPDDPVWLASLLLPGAGQMAMGDLTRGLMFLVVITGLDIAAIVFMFQMLGNVISQNPSPGAGTPGNLFLIDVT